MFYNKKIVPTEPLLRGFDDRFVCPQSRYTHVRSEDVERCKDLTVLAVSEKAGILLVKSKDNRQLFMTGHLEYDTDTLELEYKRDIKKGIAIDIPENYFPDDNPENIPLSTWRSHAHLFYSNWLNYYVYQETPFGFA